MTALKAILCSSVFFLVQSTDIWADFAHSEKQSHEVATW